jgi:hypothetical protein
MLKLCEEAMRDEHRQHHIDLGRDNTEIHLSQTVQPVEKGPYRQ